MLRHALDHARTRVVASLAIAAATVATVTGAAFAFTADGEVTEVTAAGADIRAADPPSAAELVRRDSFQEAIERRGARARAAQEADGIAGARDAKGDRYAVEPQPEPPAPAPAANQAAGGTVWDRLAQCESGGNWAATVGLYEGGLQFHPSTWDANKPSGYPDAAYQASRAQQIRVAEVVLASQGWGAWPACASELGLR